MAMPSWATKAVRLAIAIGHDADLETLQQFINLGSDSGGVAADADGDRIPGRHGPDGDRMPGSPANRSGRRPLQANDSNTLARYIQWATTGGAIPETNVILPDLPPTLLDPADLTQDVW